MLRRRLAGVLVLVLLLVAATAGLIVRSQGAARADLADRAVLRAQSGAALVTAFNQDVLARQFLLASGALVGADPAVFADVMTGLGVPDGVLVDHDGLALAVHPSNGSVVGQRLADRYPHLRAALAGRGAVSDVVPSAGRTQPIVAYAVPFESDGQRRVFSSGYLVDQTPLSRYLKTISTLPGTLVYLVDGSGVVLDTAQNGAPASGAPVPPVDLSLLDAPSPDGYTADGSQHYARAAVTGTNWRLIVLSPTDRLLAPVDGGTRWAPWALLAASTVGALLLLRVYARLLRSREQLQELANTDSLTGLSNRRHMTDLLGHLGLQEELHSLLLVDVDHFKRVNDTFGHLAGDHALQQIANVLRSTLRADDRAARWGGEEFLLWIPGTEQKEALALARRLVRVVRATPMDVGTGGDRVTITITISIGVATSDRLGPEALLHAADRALYRAKASGRDTAQLAALPLPVPLRTTAHLA